LQNFLILGNNLSLPRPKQLIALASVKLVKAAASSELSYGLTSEGKVYSWGQGILEFQVTISDPLQTCNDS
jgi:alpha-tubulin suppressor-like RCC1 family protein